MKYVLVDLANTFWRARHMAGKHADTLTKLGFCLHVTLASLHKTFRDQRADHAVICLEGRSWRKDFYDPYKRNRIVDQGSLTEDQIEEDQLFWETYEELTNFLNDQTNCTVLRCKIAEADDLIARWIDIHPDDEHVILSSDTDFYQLVSENVTQYNGVANQLIRLDGVVDDRGKPVIDKKTKEPKTIGDPEFVLFEKCVRGDSTDNIMSAYPGARKKGTKNKVGIQEAFQDRTQQGFNWNNFMLQRWVDHNDQEHIVLEDYIRNKQLIDLRAQPEWVKEAVDETIHTACQTKHNKNVGIWFMKFCGKHELVKLSEQATTVGTMLANGYQGHLNESNSSSR